MRVLVCGSRDWRDLPAIARELERIHPTLIIEGSARGADLIARDWAHVHGIPVFEIAAQWDRYGKVAGPIRNRRLLREGRPDFVFAFHENISKSKGTLNMVKQASQVAGVAVKIFAG